MSTKEPSSPSRRTVLGGVVAGVGVAVGGAALAEPARATGSAGRPAGSAGSEGAAPAVAGPAATAAAGPVSWSAVQAQLAAVGPNVTTPIANVITTKYTPGMLLGNGDLGVVVGDSSATQQTFHFGKSDFWGQNRKTTSPLVWQNSILPVGWLTVSAPGASAASSGYSMTTDLAAATVTTVLALSNATITMTSWTADNDSVLITQLSSKSGSSSVTLNATVYLPVDVAYPSGSGVMNSTQLWLTRQNNSVGNGDVSYKATAASATQLVGAAFAKTSTSTSSTQTSATGTFTLAGGATATLVTAFRSHAQDLSNPNPMPTPTQLRDQAITASNAINASWISSAASTHAAFWQDFWTRSNIVVGDSQLESYYFNAQYVLGSATRAGYNPPSLWGQWLTTDTPSWGGRYFLNYNAEALYYGAFSSNHADLTEPYRRLILNEIPWQENSTAAAGYKGMAYQRSLPPFHLYQTQPALNPVASTKDYTKLPSDQKSNASFAYLPLIWHWEYTRDITYLQNSLYPALKKLDAFWRDFAVWDGTRWVIQHSSAHEGGDDTNPNLDLGFARKVINTLIQTSAILGVDANLVPTWQSFLGKLSAYPTSTYNGVTVFDIAEVVNNPSTGDALFIPGDQPINMEGGVFPGEQFSIGGDPMLLQYAINSMTQMNSWGVTSGGNSNNGFPKEFTIAARAGWPAADLLAKFKASISYLWQSTNHTVFQHGGGVETTGATETLNSMLMQSEDGVIRVFPCWPTTHNASFTLQAKGAFLVSSSISGGSVAEVDLLSQVGGAVTLVLPWTTGTATVTANGSAVPSTVSGGQVTFTTTTGTTYKVTP